MLSSVKAQWFENILSTPLRVQLRVVFHDRRLQNTEDEQLKNWSKGRKEFETIIVCWSEII